MADKPKKNENRGNSQEDMSLKSGKKTSVIVRVDHAQFQRIIDRLPPKSGRDWHKFISIVGMAVGLGTLIVLIFQSCNLLESVRISKESADAAKQSVDIAKETIEMSRNNQRAWVGQDILDKYLKPGIIEGSPLLIVTQLQNSGKSPALKAKQRFDYDVLPKGSKLNPVYPPIAPEETSIYVIQPGAIKLVPSTKNPPLTAEEANDIRSGKKVLYFFGKVTYYDVFDRKHETTFAYRFDRSMAVWVFHNTYNDAD